MFPGTPISRLASTSAVTCATQRLHPLCPHSIAHTSRHHRGVPVLAASKDLSVRSVPLWQSILYPLPASEAGRVRRPRPWVAKTAATTVNTVSDFSHRPKILGSGFFWRRLFGRDCWRFLGAGFSAGPAEQRQGILGIERELPGGLFSRRAQGDVHAPVVGHAYGQQISKDFLFLDCGQVGIGFDQLRDLLSAHVLLKAVGPH